MLNRHITAANFFVEPVDSSARELLVIDRLTSEITLTSIHTLRTLQRSLLPLTRRSYVNVLECMTRFTLGSLMYC